jgi:mono/diheme cytochrome c family protein
MRALSQTVAITVVLTIVFITGLIIPLQAEESAGASLYRSNCAICHGPDASGNTALGKKFKVRDLKSPEVQKATDAEWFELISKGKKPMPAFSDRLKEDQIHQVIGYLRELGKK